MSASESTRPSAAQRQPAAPSLGATNKNRLGSASSAALQRARAGHSTSHVGQGGRETALHRSAARPARAATRRRPRRRSPAGAAARSASARAARRDRARRARAGTRTMLVHECSLVRVRRLGSLGLPRPLHANSLRPPARPSAAICNLAAGCHGRPPVCPVRLARSSDAAASARTRLRLQPSLFGLSRFSSCRSGEIDRCAVSQRIRAHWRRPGATAPRRRSLACLRLRSRT